jgi:hypothetical protein
LINFISNYFYKIVCCFSDNFRNKFRFFTSIIMKDILQIGSAVLLLFIRLNCKITREQISHFFKNPNTFKIQHCILNSYTTRILNGYTTSHVSNILTISIFLLLVQLIYEVRRLCTEWSRFEDDRSIVEFVQPWMTWNDFSIRLIWRDWERSSSALLWYCAIIQLRGLKNKSPNTLSVTQAILLCDVITDGKNWVNCAVLTSNNRGLRTVLSSRLSHRELRSSLRESHSFFSSPANTTMASSQGTSVSSNSFSRWAWHDTFHFNHHFLLHILCFLFFFSDNIMADVASKQQTTALFLSTIVTRTRRQTDLKKKNWQTWWETCAVPENIQFSFSCSVLHS